ncbi:cell wall-binding repeat-containing protein, partial [Ornithinimicrobium sp. LYQ103]
STNTLYEYQVYAINTVGDTWDYSDPAFNNLPPGGGFPTITVESEAVGTAVTKVVERIAGADRYATAAALSRSEFPGPVPVVFVASGLNFPDALAGGPAAAVEGGPLLLVGDNTIPAATALELTRLQPAEIVVLGGNSVVSPQVASTLENYTTGAVTRVAGGDRYATAAALSLRAFPDGATTAYVASGLTFPDSLSGGAAAAATGAPLLLVGNGGVPAATANELTRLGVTTIKVLGGPVAVSEVTATALGNYGTVQRIFGPDRYATSVAINQDAFPDNTGGTVYLATGLNFPDALAVAPTARPLVLVPGTSTALPVGAAAEIERLNPARVVIMGGTVAVSAEIEQAVRTLLGAVVITP